MLLVQQNPYNKDPNPRVLNSYQTEYNDTGVDVNSRWLVEWNGLCQGHLTTDLNNAGLKEATAWLQCEEGDLVVECERCLQRCREGVDARSPVQTRHVPHHPPSRPISRSDRGEDDASPPGSSWQPRPVLRSRRGRSVYCCGKDRERQDELGGEQDRARMVRLRQEEWHREDQSERVGTARSNASIQAARPKPPERFH